MSDVSDDVAIAMAARYAPEKTWDSLRRSREVCSAEAQAIAAWRGVARAQAPEYEFSVEMERGSHHGDLRRNVYLGGVAESGQYDDMGCWRAQVSAPRVGRIISFQDGLLWIVVNVIWRGQDAHLLLEKIAPVMVSLMDYLNRLVLLPEDRTK
jgi:hypothetical protein